MLSPAVALKCHHSSCDIEGDNVAKVFLKIIIIIISYYYQMLGLGKKSKQTAGKICFFFSTFFNQKELCLKKSKKTC